MSSRLFTALVVLPTVIFLVAGTGLVTAFNRMPSAETIIGMEDMFEIADTKAGLEKSKQELAMLETKS